MLNRDNGQIQETKRELLKTLQSLAEQENLPIPITTDLKEFEKIAGIDLQLNTCIHSQNGNSKTV